MVHKTYEEILAEEAAFANADYSRFASQLALNPGMFRLYEHPIHPWHPREFSCMLLGDVRGKRLFDMGCGMGEEAVYFAKLGAEVTAIDIAPAGIQIALDRATYNGAKIAAKVGDVDQNRIALRVLRPDSRIRHHSPRGAGPRIRRSATAAEARRAGRFCGTYEQQPPRRLAAGLGRRGALHVGRAAARMEIGRAACR